MEQEHGHAHCSVIAEKMQVSKPSVTKAMKHPKSKEYINKEAYGTITLTVHSTHYAEHLYTKYRKIKSFLKDVLGLSQEEAWKNACRIEQVISEQMLNAIDNYLSDGGEDGKHYE